MKTAIVIGIFFVLFSLTFISAEKVYYNLCLGEGQEVKFSECNPAMEDRVCENTACQFCVFINEDGAYCPADSRKCNAQGGSCISPQNNGSGIDQDPPESEIVFPQDSGIYNETYFLTEVLISETADVYYKFQDSTSWKSVCKSTTHCLKKIRFREGLNEITIKAVDNSGNSENTDLSFFTDSKDPKIKKAEPKRGFANGDFYVEFQEENPVELTLFYGNSSKVVDISNECEASTNSNKKYYCNTNVDLSSYSGQEIEYWWALEDIAGNIDEYKKQSIKIDTTFPMLNNPLEFFHYENGTKYTYFHLNISEDNFDEVVYSYLDSKGKVKEKRICSRLKDNLCEKRFSFKRGNQDITVIIRDEAGNVVAYPISFFVDY